MIQAPPAPASGARASRGARTALAPPPPPPPARRRRRSNRPPAATGGKGVGAGLKSVWVGAEALGKLLAAARGDGAAKGAGAPSASGRPLGRAEALALLREDYAVDYFVSGKGALAAYAPDCRFADDFASFRGTERFRANVSNLGALLTDVRLDLADWDEAPDARADALRTRWRFSAVLALPWRPRLAAAGRTTHVFDAATGRVVEHLEEWDIEPGKVVKSLLKPAAAIPTNRAEALALALHDGDAAGVWSAASPGALRWGGAALGGTLAWAAARGEAPGAPAAAAALVVAAAAASELRRLVGGAGGGGL